MSSNYIFIIAGIILGLIFLLRKIITKHVLPGNNRLFLHSILFVACISFLGYHFYQKGMNEGFIAIALGSIAFGKYIYDSRKK